MAVNGQQGIGLLLKAEDQISGPAKKAGDSVVGMSGRVMKSAELIDRAMKAAAGGVAVFMAGFKALKGAFGLAKEAGKFQQEMAAVKAIMGANTKQFKDLEKAAFKAGLVTQFSPLEAAKALRAFGQAGLKSEAAMRALVPTLDLAAVSLGKLSPEAATGVVNAALKTFGLTTNKARQAVDAMVHTTNSFNISIGQLPVAIGNVSRGAIALNQDMRGTLIALGLVKNVLPDISRASTLTSSAMLRIADPTIQKKLKKLGVTFKNSKGNFLPVLEIFQNLDKQLRVKFSTAAKQAGAAVKILGKQGILPFAVIMKQLNKGLESLPKGFNKGRMAVMVMRFQMQAAEGNMKAVEKLASLGLPKAFVAAARASAKLGASKKFAKTLLDTFQGSLTLLEGAVKGFKTAVGAPLAEVFKPFVRAAFVTVGFVSKKILNMNPIVKRLAATFFLVASAVILVKGAVIGLTAALKFLKPVLMKTMLPFLKILALAAAIAAVAVLIRAVWETNFLGIKTAVLEVWKGIKEGFLAVFLPTIQMIKPIFSDLTKTLGEFFKELKIVLVDLGLISNKTAKDMTSGWRLFGQAIGVALGAVVKTVAFVFKGLSMIVRLLGALGKAIGGKLAGGKFEFKIPKALQDAAKNGLFTTPDKSVLGASKAAGVAAAPGTAIGGGRVAPLPLALRRSPTPPSGRLPQAILDRREATPLEQTKNIQLNGDVVLDGEKVGTMLLNNRNANRNAGGVRTRSR